MSRPVSLRTSATSGGVEIPFHRDRARLVAAVARSATLALHPRAKAIGTQARRAQERLPQVSERGAHPNPLLRAPAPNRVTEVEHLVEGPAFLFVHVVERRVPNLQLFEQLIEPGDVFGVF